MIEFFCVPPDEDATFLAVWAAEAGPGAMLYRTLRSDAPWRFVSIASDAPAPSNGVLLIVPFDVRVGADLPGWESVRALFGARRGFLGARLDRDADDRYVAVVHWSSPLMYARTVRAEGDVIAALPYGAEPVVCAPVVLSSRASLR